MSTVIENPKPTAAGGEIPSVHKTRTLQDVVEELGETMNQHDLRITDKNSLTRTKN